MTQERNKHEADARIMADLGPNAAADLRRKENDGHEEMRG